MAPVVQALKAAGLEVPVLATAQHRHLLDQMLSVFGLSPTWDLDVMQVGQGLADLTGRLMPALDRVFGEVCPDVILAQGDTTTVFCAALASFYRGIPFAHVEAGLRSGDLAAPFPEEALRRLTAVVTRWHFAPTLHASEALQREGHDPSRVHVVGNTVIDALLDMAKRPDLPWPPAVPPLASGERLVLVTLHRRENFGEPLGRILDALAAFADRHLNARLVYLVHPNPNVSGVARERLGGKANVTLCDPLDYPALVRLLKASFLVLTDSGGLQEEGPALGKPVLVFRDVTERPEAVEAGGAALVGSDPERFRDIVERLWDDASAYADMARPRFPYGQGDASRRIADILSRDLTGG